MRALVVGGPNIPIMGPNWNQKFEIIDQNSHVPEAISDAVDRIVAAGGLDGVVAAVPEVLESVSHHAHVRSLPHLGAPASRHLSSRASLRARLAECGLSQPKYRVAVGAEEGERVANGLELPVYLVPEPSRSENENAIEHREDLRLGLGRVLKSASNNGVVLESHHLGPVSSLYYAVSERTPLIMATIQHITARVPYRFPVALVTSSQSDARLEAISLRTVEALEIETGLVRIDLVEAAEGPLVLEVDPLPAWRWMPADLVALAGGESCWDIQLRLATGQSVRPSPPPEAAALAWMRPRAGKVVSVTGEEEARALEGVVDVQVHVMPGEVLRHAVDPAGSKRVGFVAATGANPVEASARVEAALQRCEIKTTTVA